MEIQHAEFEISKKSLVKDLQNRCEKVCPAGGSGLYIIAKKLIVPGGGARNAA
jgi:hypothetical protein